MVSDRPTAFTTLAQADNDLSLLELINLIAATLGIHIQPQHQETFKSIILNRIKVLGLSSFAAYYRHLLAKKQQAPGECEWQELILQLTVTESYFFRDQGQFGLLRNQILPELIERKRQQCFTQATPNQRLSLRLWSAGCSTGEEAYSLAILLRELIPDYQEWNILILGTDINQSAIAIAQQGIYSDWSFRATDLEVKNRYFRSHRKGWEIDCRIRNMVTFQAGNLRQDSYPNDPSKIHDLDLILCRNVFIYFDFSSIAQVLEKFYRALAPGGFLLTGHTELHGQKIAPFQVKNFPHSVVYQKKIGQCNQTTIPNFTPAKSLCHHSATAWEKGVIVQQHKTDSNNPNNSNSRLQKTENLTNVGPLLPGLGEGSGVKAVIPQTLFEQAQRSLIQEVYDEAIQTAKQLTHFDPQHFQAHCLLAEAYANLGQYADATQACQQALHINSLAPEPYYLLAQISEEQGDIDSAKLFLKRIIYLVPTAVSAYLELGSIHEREGNIKQAQKTWQSLLEILHSLPQEQAIAANNQQTIAELKAYVLEHLSIHS